MSKRRRPSRKMAWSSAIIIRTGSCVISGNDSFVLSGYFYFQTCTLTRPSIDRQFTADGTHPLFDDHRSPASMFQFGMRKPARKFKTATIVVDGKKPRSVLQPKLHQHVVRHAVFLDRK